MHPKVWNMQAAIDIRAPAHGFLRAVLVKVDDAVTVGQVVAVLEEGSKPFEGTQPEQPASTSSGQSTPQPRKAQSLEELNFAASEVSDNAMRGKKARIRFPPRKTDLGHTISAMPKVDQEKYRARASSIGLTSNISFGTPRSSMAASMFSKEPVKHTRILEAEMESIMLGGAPP